MDITGRARLKGLNRTGSMMRRLSEARSRPAAAAMARALLVLPVALGCLCSSACTCASGRVDPADRAVVTKARQDLRPLRSVAAGRLPPALRAYLDLYGIRAGGAGHPIGTFQSGGLVLASQLIRSSKQGRGTVIIVHGYFDHSGIERHLINRLTGEEYSVAIYDHPGHGLSEGRRISTKDFSIYETGFSDFLDVVTRNQPAPYHVVAHSMGCTVVIDHLLRKETTRLKRVVLVAPLIRDSISGPIRVFGHVVSPVIDYLPRVAERSSSDPAFLDSLKADPLQFRCVSTHWSRAFVAWQRSVRDSGPRRESPLILNAGNDTVIVDEFGQRWMKRTFPAGRFLTIEGGHHHLLNEAQPIREQVLDIISSELRR